MSTQVKRRRGTAAENASFTGAIAELVFLTDAKRGAIHDAVKAGGYHLPTALDLLNGALTRGTASGTNTYALTLPDFPTSYSAGLEIDVTFTNANTSSCTLNVNGVGASGMKDETGTNFTTGQIGAGSRYTFRHNGTEWRRVSGAAGAIKSVKRQVFTASGTYTPSTGMLYCDVEVQGAGGGGRGSSNGGAGGNTTFGALLTGNGGSAGVSGGAGAGGTGASGDINITGQQGNGAMASFYASSSNGGSNLLLVGAKAGMGGDSFLGKGGTVGGSGVGYGGGGSTRLASVASDDGGGGGGGYARKVFDAATIGASQTVTIGAAGSAGGSAGAGTAGVVIVTEYCSQ